MKQNTIAGWVMLLACLALLGTTVRRWERSAPARESMETIPATVLARGPSGAKMQVTSSFNDVDALLRILTVMREIVQNRQEPPVPHGEVLGGNPTNPANLREYPEEEKQAITKEWREEIPTHDRKVVEQITTMERALPADTSAHGESAPIPQPEEPKP